MMEKYFRSFALIRSKPTADASWFCRRDARRGWLDFVAAKCEARGSFRESLRRELEASAGLGRNDVLVANMAQVNLEFGGVLPGQDKPSHVGVSFYLVHLFNDRGRETLQRDPTGRWVSWQELHAGETNGGDLVNPTLTYLLRESQVLPVW